MAKTLSVSDSLAGILKTINEYFTGEKRLYQVDNTEYKIITADDFSMNKFRVFCRGCSYRFVEFVKAAQIQTQRMTDDIMTMHEDEVPILSEFIFTKKQKEHSRQLMWK